MTNSKKSCSQITTRQAEKGDCTCHGAVMNAYGNIREGGCPERFALEAAYAVYRYHHPEDSKEDARLTVERWIYAGDHAH